MSLLRRHGTLGRGAYATPAFVRSQTTGAISSATYSMPLSVTPVEGNLMILCFGGAQTRNYSSGLSGWTRYTNAGGGSTCIMAYKIAGPSESTSISVTLSGSLQGSMEYVEVSNADTSVSFQDEIQAAPSSTLAHSYSSDVPFVAVTNFSIAISAGMTIDDGFGEVYDAGRHATAYKVSPANIGTVTWTAGTSANCKSNIILFRGKKL